MTKSSDPPDERSRVPEEFDVAIGVATQFEAHFFLQVLRDEGIPFVTREYHDTALDGVAAILHEWTGWGEVRVRASDRARVEALLAEVRASAPGGDETDDR